MNDYVDHIHLFTEDFEKQQKNCCFIGYLVDLSAEALLTIAKSIIF